LPYAENTYFNKDYCPKWYDGSEFKAARVKQLVFRILGFGKIEKAKLWLTLYLVIKCPIASGVPYFFESF